MEEYQHKNTLSLQEAYSKKKDLGLLFIYVLENSIGVVLIVNRLNFFERDFQVTGRQSTYLVFANIN